MVNFPFVDFYECMMQKENFLSQLPKLHRCQETLRLKGCQDLLLKTRSSATKAIQLLTWSSSQVWFTVIRVFVFTFILHNVTEMFYCAGALPRDNRITFFRCTGCKVSHYICFIEINKQDSNSLNCLLAIFSRVHRRQCRLACVGASVLASSVLKFQYVVLFCFLCMLAHVDVL